MVNKFLAQLLKMCIKKAQFRYLSMSARKSSILERRVASPGLLVTCFIVESLRERNNKAIRGLKRDPSDVWSLVRFHVSLWGLVMKVFRNYSIGVILNVSPFFWAGF